MRDGWYINENEEKLVHSMVFPDNHKLKEKLKGIKQVPEVLISVPVTTIHKFACKSWRYMDAYNKGLEGRTAEWAVSKYKSHHRLPDNIERIMDDLDNL
uniref:Uncharacterized protein n=1 Tax=Rhizophagus irregularis (strain DAOM 181602 / DAOM 197198 / MUCL 43194) TaxID=747089 RepID=U9UU72_RHIID